MSPLPPGKVPPRRGFPPPLNPLARAIILSAVLAPFAAAQEGATPPPDELLPIPAARFTPPPPPKEVPPMVVKASTTLKRPTHRITVLRGEASTLPDLPPPPPAAEPPPRAPSGEACYLIAFGAMVYDRRISHVTWSNPRTGGSFEAWCDWDWTLLSPLPRIGIGERTETFFLFPTEIDTAAGLRFGRKSGIPEHPAIPADGFVITKGDPGDPAAGKLLAALRDFHLRHKDRLLLIQRARDEYRAEAAAWHAANPPKPVSHTIWLKPHRGSRYLEKEGGTR